MGEPLKVFITYSHEDIDSKNKLRQRLAVMEQQGMITIWHDNEILPGDKWYEDISRNLNESDILLYLVSASSLASKNCNKELAEALSGEIRVIPIILEGCDWLNHQLSDIQALPDQGKPINEWQPESNGWQNVVEGLRKVVSEIQSHAKPASRITDEEIETLAYLALQQGDFLVMLGQPDKAIEAYSRAITHSPSNATAYINRSIAYFSKGVYDRAIADCNKAIELNSDNATAYNNRGTIYLSKGIYDLAIADCNKAIELNSDNATAYNNRGVAYYGKGVYDLAIKDFNKAIVLNSDSASAYNNRGNAYRDKGEFDRAIEDFNKAITLNLYDASAYNNRGNAYVSKGTYDRAIEDFNKAIALNPTDATAYSNRGNAYRDKNEPDRAIEDYNKAIELNPNYAVAYNNRGNAYSDKGTYNRAISDFDRAIELNPDYVRAYYNRGATYRDKGEIDRAIEDYSKAIGLNPVYADAYQNRGAVYRDKGAYDLAITDYNKVIKLNPDDALAYNNRGATYGIKGEIDRAITDYDKAIELTPKFALAYYNRGATYKTKGVLDRAIADYNKVIELDPELALAYYNRGEAWLRLREWDKAKTDLTDALNRDVDIIAAFRKDYKTVVAFERRHDLQLPEDIAAMLTQRRRSRFPNMQKDLIQQSSPRQDQYSSELNLSSQKKEVLSAIVTPPKSPDVVNLREKSPNVVNLRERLRNAGTPLGQYVETPSHFGLKTGMDDAFVVDGELRDKLIADHSASADILKPFLHGRNIRRWQADAQDLWLIFAYRGIEIDAYPAILNHLKKYRDSLSKRAGKQEWYELQAVPGDSEYFTQPKLVCPNRYNHQTFAVDTDGLYCGDTCYLIPTEETWLCGVLNSNVVEWFYSQVSDQLTADELRTLSGYMQQIPIPNATSTQKTLIGKIVNYLIYLQQQPTTNSKNLAHARDYMMLKYFERIIDGLVYECYLPDVLHQSDKYFFKPLLDEHLPQLEEIPSDKMTAFREIFEHLYERTHPVRKNLFFLDSLKPIRIIEGNW